jgi:hypothetical protein
MPESTRRSSTLRTAQASWQQRLDPCDAHGVLGQSCLATMLEDKAKISPEWAEVLGLQWPIVRTAQSGKRSPRWGSR